MLPSLLLAFQTAAAAAPPPQKLTLQEYRIDAGHSIVEFSVPFTVTRVKGRFPHVLGTILYDPVAPERSSVSIVIDAKSIDTGWDHRDEHLRTDDFFDVERYPTINFQSERVERAGEHWIARGPFTMRGVTREVAIPFRFVQPPSRSRESGWMELHVVGALKLDRRDYGVHGGDKHNSWFNAARQATVGDTVDVSIELEGYLADAGAPRLPQVTEAVERIRAAGVEAQIQRLRERRGDRTDVSRSRPRGSRGGTGCGRATAWGCGCSTRWAGADCARSSFAKLGRARSASPRPLRAKDYRVTLRAEREARCRPGPSRECNRTPTRSGPMGSTARRAPGAAPRAPPESAR